MPIAIYTCSEGHSLEVLHPVGARPQALTCRSCAGEAVLDLPATFRPARTASRWGDSQGYYDRGLGRHIANAPERERIMKQRGLVSEADLGSGVAEQGVHEAITEKLEHTKQMTKYKDLVKSGVSQKDALSTITSEA